MSPAPVTIADVAKATVVPIDICPTANHENHGRIPPAHLLTRDANPDIIYHARPAGHDPLGGRIIDTTPEEDTEEIPLECERAWFRAAICWRVN